MTSTEKGKPVSKKRIILFTNILITVSITALIAWGISTYFVLDRREFTNDAQVEQYITPVSTRVSGYIKSVRFSEHSRVKKGDTLVLIDDREYRISLEQARAAYLSAQAARGVSRSGVNTVQSNLAVSDANIKAAQARVWNAKQNFDRYRALVAEGAATQQQFDQVKTEYDALLSATQALIRQRGTTSLSTAEASSKLGVNDAEIKRTRALLDMAELNLSYTVITAPYDGFTGRRNIQEGQLLQAGQGLLSLVRNDSKWVTANFKETQIPGLEIGQLMDMKIDGAEGAVFKGRIAAISEATGSRYSSVPTDNSTGNFVKVRQRIPVKIDFLDAGGQQSLLEKVRAGMNVEVRASENLKR